MGLRISCPNCGSRPYEEFWFGGELPEPDEDELDHVWLRRNVAGRQMERWFHYAGCRRWLTVERDTLTNAVHAAY